MWRHWSISRQAKLLLIRFVRLRGQPDEIARGFALGIFIGMTPTLGVQMLLALLLALLLCQNKLAAALGVWISNPLTAPFLYLAQYETGRFLLDMPRVQFPRCLTLECLQQLGADLLLPLCFGSLIHAILAAAISYALVLRLLPVLKTWRVPRWPRPFRKHRSYDR
ncbi:MAG: DUF2062 domain-containing protein [Desulfuromonas sp.]|jgi:uncharacterized protein (DUF2062 family)|uniref:DUF2062 domain-containing protein n=1 Tax=Desulfuromonas thiophila TaxID=57664 RepID=UPI0024A8D659|nr:DUF2062 domain-containing protein [Desulfuromonas thiophila]MDD3802456.1 DUF2062 domain-containing protein [Desulfuromonas thiophila]